jgi:hypothetical protein
MDIDIVLSDGQQTFWIYLLMDGLIFDIPGKGQPTTLTKIIPLCFVYGE